MSWEEQGGPDETPLGGGDATPDVPLGQLTLFDSAQPIPEHPAADAPPSPRRKSPLREWAESLAFVIVFILIFTGYVAQATKVPTPSMKPTILVGDHFFIEKVAYPGNFPAAIRSYLPRREIRRGDIIVFKSPVPGKIPFVKRVIGVPTDQVQIRNKEVTVNGRRLNEPYKIHLDPSTYEDAHWTPEELKRRDNYGPVVVPADSFFVMGDNRDNSNDSRYWGFVHRDDILGKPLFVYWSYESNELAANTSFGAWAREYLSVATHFFSRTRWFRTGTVVE